MNDTEGTWVASFDKNSSEAVRVRLFRGAVGRYCEIRVWSKVRAGDGAPSTPTDNGLILDVDLLPELGRAIDEAIGERVKAELAGGKG